MSLHTVTPWQSFFTVQTLNQARRILSTRGVTGLRNLDGHRRFCGMVMVHKGFHVTIELSAPVAGPDRVLRAAGLSIACRCVGSSYEPCAHAAVLLEAYCRLGKLAPAPYAEIAEGRSLRIAEGLVNEEEDEDEDDWLNEDEDEDEDGQDAEQEEETDRGNGRPIANGPAKTRTRVDRQAPASPEPLELDIAPRFADPEHPVAPIARWLDEHLAVSPEVERPERQLAYLLHPPTAAEDGDERAPAWTISVLAARRTKSGDWGILRRYEDPESAIDRGGDLLRTADHALLSALSGVRSTQELWGDDQVRLDASLPGLLLEQLLATGRCYLAELAFPLRQGEPLAAEPQWTSEEHGSRWRLRLHTPLLPDAHLLPTSPPWYLAGERMGPLHSCLDPAHAAALISLPPIPLAQLPQVAQQLHRSMPGVPPPPIVQPSTAPTGYLLRCQVSVTWDSSRHGRQAGPANRRPYTAPVEVAVILVSYGELLCDPLQVLTVADRHGQPVLRDRAAEGALMRQLELLGLRPLEDVGQEIGLHWGRGLPAGGARGAHAVSIGQAAPGTPCRIPAAVLAALAASGWTIAGEGGPVTPALPAAIEARFQDDLAAVGSVRTGNGAREFTGEDGDDGGWFQLELGVRFGDRRVDLTPLLAELIAGGPEALAGLPLIQVDGRGWVCLDVPDGGVVRVPLDLLTRLVDHMTALFDRPPGPGGWRADPWQALALQGLQGLDAAAPQRLCDLAERLGALCLPSEAPSPAGLRAELRPYQRAGLAWLSRLAAAGVGGILADDMGLGKTVQAIAHLLAERAAGRLKEPALVVGPASMVGTWRRELARFAPDLAVAVLHGPARPRSASELGAAAVVITTYATLLRDTALVSALRWSVIIADEAQFMANPGVKSGQAVRRLPCAQRLALTGTPLSNHLGELYVLLAWAVPGLLGSPRHFQDAFRKPIEQQGEGARAQLLRRRIAPFLLRRTKEAVAPELPPRTETLVTVELEGAQRALYESVRLAMDDRIREVLAAKGLARSRIEVLEALTRLRLCCCDPRLVKAAPAAATPAATPRAALVPVVPASGEAAAGQDSAKLAWLREMLPQLIEEGRRILLFSSFTSWLDLVERDVLSPANISWLRLDGSTVDRDTPVQCFQAGLVPLFLLSLKAGGTGLNLTAADTVILADPWWNAAAEAQAADRAHRIGQDRPVFVWRLVCAGTVEERMLALQERKRALLDALLDPDGQSVPGFSADDLAALLAPLPA